MKTKLSLKISTDFLWICCKSALQPELFCRSSPELCRFVEPDPSHTLEERVVQWYFSQLDNNGSHDVNKKELKPFKRYLKKKAKPKRCARKFTDYCDRNKDRAISLPELKGCLGVGKEGEDAPVGDRRPDTETWRWSGVLSVQEAPPRPATKAPGRGPTSSVRLILRAFTVTVMFDSCSKLNYRGWLFIEGILF